MQISCFLRKNKNNISECRRMKILLRVLSVKMKWSLLNILKYSRKRMSIIMFYTNTNVAIMHQSFEIPAPIGPSAVI